MLRPHGKGQVDSFMVTLALSAKCRSFKATFQAENFPLFELCKGKVRLDVCKVHRFHIKCYVRDFSKSNNDKYKLKHKNFWRLKHKFKLRIFLLHHQYHHRLALCNDFQFSWEVEFCPFGWKHFPKQYKKSRKIN